MEREVVGHALGVVLVANNDERADAEMAVHPRAVTLDLQPFVRIHRRLLRCTQFFGKKMSV
jgi:hypothetical protein